MKAYIKPKIVNRSHIIFNITPIIGPITMPVTAAFKLFGDDLHPELTRALVYRKNDGHWDIYR